MRDSSSLNLRSELKTGINIMGRNFLSCDDLAVPWPVAVGGLTLRIYSELPVHSIIVELQLMSSD